MFRESVLTLCRMDVEIWIVCLDSCKACRRLVVHSKAFGCLQKVRESVLTSTKETFRCFAESVVTSVKRIGSL